jgi:hypothetical protein
MEQELLSRIKCELLGSEYQAIFADAMKRLLSDGTCQAEVDHRQRESQMPVLSGDIERYLDAIASGIDSATLKERLKKAEEKVSILAREQASRASKADQVVRFLPYLAERYERIVGEAERALLVDVDRARNSLRGFLGEEKNGSRQQVWQFIAEDRIDDESIIRKCLSGNQNIRMVAGARYVTYLHVCRAAPQNPKMTQRQRFWPLGGPRSRALGILLNSLRMRTLRISGLPIEDDPQLRRTLRVRHAHQMESSLLSSHSDLHSAAAQRVCIASCAVLWQPIGAFELQSAGPHRGNSCRPTGLQAHPVIPNAGRPPAGGTSERGRGHERDNLIERPLR